MSEVKPQRQFSDEPKAPQPDSSPIKRMLSSSHATKSNPVSYDPGPLRSRRGVLRRRRYSVSTLSVLTRRYVKVRGDLLVSIGDGSQLGEPERRYAKRCSEYLGDAKRELESRHANFFVCTNLLFLADVTLVWLYPKGILELRCEAAKARLAELGPDAAWMMNALFNAQTQSDDRFLRSALEDALNFLQEPEQDIAIADDLQVTRLRMLMLYMVAALALLVGVVPYVTIDLTLTDIQGWPVRRLPTPELTQWAAAIAICVIGAVGGILSGLLVTRDASTTLLDYRASVLKLALKPLVGAVAALTLYLFLSWQILTGIQITSGGTFLLVGFLAGFSERYFLRLLQAETPQDGQPSASTRIQGTGVAPTQAEYLHDRGLGGNPFDGTGRGTIRWTEGTPSSERTPQGTAQSVPDNARM